ncbi:hypothetical protein Ddc_15967 [Ditylenchus destructor]|nr:hypothetical protein Ddc_15967 [Ditylenchus destructor]
MSGKKYNENFTEPKAIAQLTKDIKAEAVGSESDLKSSVSKEKRHKKRTRSVSPSISSPRKKRTKMDEVKCEMETLHQKAENGKGHVREDEMDLYGQGCSGTVQRALEMCDEIMRMLTEGKSEISE